MDIVIREGSQIAGTAHVILLDNNTAKIESFTVLPEHGKQIGRSLMKKIDGYLKEKQIKNCTLDSPKFIKGFYEKFEYVQEDWSLWSKMCRR